MRQVANALTLALSIDFQAVEVSFGASYRPLLWSPSLCCLLPSVRTKDRNWNFIFPQNITQGNKALKTLSIRQFIQYDLVLLRVKQCCNQTTGVGPHKDLYPEYGCCKCLNWTRLYQLHIEARAAMSRRHSHHG